MTLQASEMLPSETIDGEELANYCEPTIAELLALWKSKRGGSRLPARRAFDFGELKPWLGHIILFDVVPDGLDDGADFRYRLVGSNLTRVLGIDPTGRSVSEFCLTVDPTSALSNLRTIVRNRLPRYRSSMMPCADGRSFTPARLFLPLSSDGLDVDIILLYGGFPRDRDGSPRRLDAMAQP